MSTAIRLSKVAKSFGEVKAVDGVDLEIADGEFFAMLGPSGSGKTTVLRLIAILELSKLMASMSVKPRHLIEM